MTTKHLTPDDDIKLANFSVRTFNALTRFGIKTISELTHLSEPALYEVDKLGKKSVEEVLEFQQKFKESPDSYFYDASVITIDKTFYDEEGFLRKDIPLKEIGLSVRSYNGLKRMGHEYASEILHLEEGELRKANNLGKNSVQEIINTIERLEFTELVDNSKIERTDCRDYAKKLSKVVHISEQKAYYELYDLFLQAESEQRTLTQNEIFNNAVIRCKVKNKIKNSLKQFDFGTDIKNILELFSSEIVELSIIQPILGELKSVDEIMIINELVLLKRMTVLEYVDSIEKEAWRDILKLRLDGFTLEEIGLDFNMTRERVRQITSKFINNMPDVLENRYVRIFEHFKLSKADFLYIFNETETTYNYLSFIVKKPGGYKLDELMEDDELPIDIRRRVRDIVYKDYIQINNDWIPKSKLDLIDYIIRIEFYEEGNFDDFIKMYYDKVHELGLLEDAKVNLGNERSQENNFNLRHLKVLWKNGRKFRYYDIHSYDFTELFGELQLEQYRNIELSTFKFFKEHPELMERYDIRDEYELHNLLKKIDLPNEICDINFGRMPMITFGIANRDEQVLDMLIDSAPISLQDFAGVYEEEYGVTSQTFMANYLTNFNEYLSNGVFCIEVNPLQKFEFDRMAAILTDDFYLVRQIKEIYKREFPESTVNINPYILKTLGFNVFTDYVVKNNFETVTAYVQSLFMDGAFVDTREFPLGLTSKSSYTCLLYKLRGEYEIIEHQPDVYINIKALNQIGVFKDEIMDYNNHISNILENGDYFTIESLKQMGFKHSLDRCGYSQTFYESLLLGENSEFNYLRVGGAKLFVKGSHRVTFAKFLEDYIAKYGTTPLSDLQDKLNSFYGINSESYKLVERIKNSCLYYDPLDKVIYANYEYFLASNKATETKDDFNCRDIK